MRALVQRVNRATVLIPEENYKSSIKKGMLILLGIKEGDKIDESNFIADKCSNLRIFADENDKMNLSLKDIDGEVLIISQFTLYGMTKKGNRPNFMEAAKPDEAIPLYESFISRVKENLGASKVKTGIFGSMMQIELVNDGPVTIIVEQ